MSFKSSTFDLHFCPTLTILGGSLLLFVSMATGCGTTTQRLATEQMLMSDAVDQAVSQIDFSNLSGQTVYLDTTYLKPIRGTGFVNADYIVSSLRQQLTSSRCLIQDSREEATVIVEPRVGALGTDGHEVTYGLPQSSALATAAAAISSSPVPAFPEVSFGKVDAQSGIAKVIVYAYDRESKQPVWQSGVAKAESSSNNTWILGAGPFQKGSIYDDVRFAGRRINRPPVNLSDPQFAKRSPNWLPRRHREPGPPAEDLIADPAYDQPFVFSEPSKPSKPKTESTELPEKEDSVQQASHQEVERAGTD